MVSGWWAKRVDPDICLGDDSTRGIGAAAAASVQGGVMGKYKECTTTLSGGVGWWASRGAFALPNPKLDHTGCCVGHTTIMDTHSTRRGGLINGAVIV